MPHFILWARSSMMLSLIPLPCSADGVSPCPYVSLVQTKKNDGMYKLHGYPGSPKTKLCPLVDIGSRESFTWILLKTSHFVWSTGLPGDKYDKLVYLQYPISGIWWFKNSLPDPGSWVHQFRSTRKVESFRWNTRPLKLTASSPLKIGHLKRKSHLPTIHFSGANC